MHVHDDKLGAASPSWAMKAGQVRETKPAAFHSKSAASDATTTWRMEILVLFYGLWPFVLDSHQGDLAEALQRHSNTYQVIIERVLSSAMRTNDLHNILTS
jgi:hypothetical protein